MEKKKPIEKIRDVEALLASWGYGYAHFNVERAKGLVQDLRCGASIFCDRLYDDVAGVRNHASFYANEFMSRRGYEFRLAPFHWDVARAVAHRYESLVNKIESRGTRKPKKSKPNYRQLELGLDLTE